ncbi:MAG: hypothetical protein IJ173_00930 [Kiritimatiellae bacterium]|nr:hypothetical protein [Kiritimatiellia bacterium]
MKKLLIVAVAAALFADGSTAFAEDAYIENTNGNQYFNTGHFVGPNTKIVLDFKLNETTLGITPFGAKGDNGTANRPWFRCYLGEKTSGGGAWFSINQAKADYNASGYNVHPADLSRYTMIMDLPGKIFRLLDEDGTEVATQTFESVSSGTQIYPLGLFATCAHNSGAYATATATWERPAKMRVYGLEIYESGTLVKKFVPWVKGGVAGLKDTVSGVFHSGENARACVAGGDITVEKDDPWVGFPDNDVMTAAAVKGKTMYFDTGYAFNPESRIELDYALLTPDWTSSSKWAGETYLFYVAGASGAVYLLPYGSSANGRHYMKVGSKEGGITEVGVDYGYNVRRKIVATASNMKMITAGYTNWNVSADSGQEVATTLNSPTLTLGYRSGKPPLPAKIYGLKIYESNNLVHDFVPSISNSVPILRDTLATPTLGLLPTVYNSPGTNIVCEAGGNIQGDEDAKDAYLDFDGVKGHGIDIGYVLTKDSRIEMDFAVWNNNYAISGSGSAIFFEQRGYKDAESERNGIWFHLYQPDAGRYGWCFADYAKAKNEWTSVYITNERTKFVCDAPANTITAYRGGVQVYQSTNMSRGGVEAITATTCTSTLRIGSNWDGKTNQTGMRLYNVKIYNSGVLDRNFVPCLTNGIAGLYETCQNRFFPLTGGTVRGKGLKGAESDILIAPQPARLTRKETSNTATLTCLAIGAQSYEWYEDGVLISGETSDSLTLEWSKAKANNYAHTYSVKPVYTVFNERVAGEAVSATVEYTPLGMVIIIK